MVTLRRIDTVHSGLDGSPFFSSHFFTYVVGEAADAAAGLANFWSVAAASITSGLSMQIQTEQTILEDTTGVITGVENAAFSAIAGQIVGGDLAPAATQGLLRLRTGTFRDGREIRGRLFIPGITEAVGSHVPGSAFINDIDTAASQLRTGSAGFGPWRVWSRPRAATETLPAREGSSAVISAASTWDQWAVLRSRRD